MRVYQMNLEEVADYFNSDLMVGKPNSTQIKNGKEFAKKLSFLRDIFAFLFSKFSYITIVALVCCAIALIFSALNQSWNLFWVTIGAVSLLIVLCFAESALLCYYKSKYDERSVSARQAVRVIRSGEVFEIDPSDLMLGDLIIVEEGTILYCDARVVECDGLFAEEGNVFGLSIPAEKVSSAINEKNVEPRKQKNMLWKGSYISGGCGRAVVTAVDSDCYVEKTGGRKQRKQRSFFYNKQSNIGRIASYVYLILCAICLFMTVLFTNRYVEAFVVTGVMTSLFLLNPITTLMEWAYYRSASAFYNRGFLIRNIEAFDGMNKEKELYFDADKLITNQLRYSHTIDIHGTEKSAVSYFALCMGQGYFADELKKTLANYGLTFEKLDRNFPVFRRDIDSDGNVFSLFSNNGNSVIVSVGYWKKMIPMLRKIDEDLIHQIHELEIHGNMVYLMASDGMNFIPNKLELSEFRGKLDLSSLVTFKLPVDQKVRSMVAQLRHSSMKVYLISDHSDELANFLLSSYDFSGLVMSRPEKNLYSLPGTRGDSLAVYEDASSPIERERAMVVLRDNATSHELIYKVKCMFCGLRRCLNFLSITCISVVATTFVLFLSGVSADKLIFSLLLLKPALICPCYYLIESVRNCNKYRRSFILGMFCGSSGFVAALIGCDAAIFTLSLSMVLLSAYFMISGRKYRNIRKKDIIYMVLSLILVIIPAIFASGNWLPALLLALFPPMAAFVVDLFY